MVYKQFTRWHSRIDERTRRKQYAPQLLKSWGHKKAVFFFLLFFLIFFYLFKKKNKKNKKAVMLPLKSNPFTLKLRVV